MIRALSPWRLGDLTLRNRLIKAATFEGSTPDGRPSDALVALHRRLAAGGIGMTTVAYGAVAAGGRTFDRQLLLNADATGGLRRLTDAVHAEGAAACLQLADAGGFSKLPGPRGPSGRLNRYGLAMGVPWVRPMKPADLDACVAAFAAATALARKAGFDAVELHVGHGYLLHQFLSPRTNHRTDALGGALDRRLTFPLRVLGAVREAAGGMAVLAKSNLADGHRGGLEVADAIVITRALLAGGADAVVLSGGVVDHTPFFLLRGDTPVAGMVEVEKNAFQKLALRLFAPLVLRPVPYQPLFFLDMARQVRQAVQGPLVLLGGVTDAPHVVRAMDEGFEAVQVGRALIHDPDWPRHIAADARWASGCTHCNLCMVEMDRHGVRCPVAEGPTSSGPTA